jgi:phthiodiolone/phenolphthiodiolone dimycocerosates ketoreductase
MWTMLILHDAGEEEEIEQLFANELLRWQVAAFGRLNQREWLEEGFTPPLGPDWHYAMKLLPTRWTAAQVKEVTVHVTDEMIRKSFFIGTPAQVGASIQAYVDAGVTWVLVTDLRAGLDKIPDPLRHSIELCRYLKAPVTV